MVEAAVYKWIHLKNVLVIIEEREEGKLLTEVLVQVHCHSWLTLTVVLEPSIFVIRCLSPLFCICTILHCSELN